MNTIIIINCRLALILEKGVYLHSIFIHLNYVSTFSYIAVVVLINSEETEEGSKVNLLQIYFPDGQRHSLFILQQYCTQYKNES